MSGFQEILLILFLVLALLVLPRSLGRGKTPPNTASPPRLPARALTGRLRLALALSVAWPLLTAAYLQPWESDDWLSCVWAGPGVVALAWGAWWVKEGFRRHRR